MILLCLPDKFERPTCVCDCRAVSTMNLVRIFRARRILDMVCSAGVGLPLSGSVRTTPTSLVSADLASDRMADCVPMGSKYPPAEPGALGLWGR